MAQINKKANQALAKTHYKDFAQENLIIQEEFDKENQKQKQVHKEVSLINEKISKEIENIKKLHK